MTRSPGQGALKEDMKDILRGMVTNRAAWINWDAHLRESVRGRQSIMLGKP